MSESSTASVAADQVHHVTPYYRISYEVCNAPHSKILTLNATGTNVTFTPSDHEGSTLVRDELIAMDEANHLYLKDTVSVSQATVIIYVKQQPTPQEELADTFTALSRLPLPRNNQLDSNSLPESDPLRHDNQMYLVLHFSKSFCTDKTTTLSTIIIVTLSVICLLLLTSLTLAIVILRRKKPYLFSAKGSPHESTSSNQVAPW